MSEVFTRGEVQEQSILDERSQLLHLLELRIADMDWVHRLRLNDYGHENSNFVRLQSHQLFLSLLCILLGFFAFVRTGKTEAGQIGLLEDPLHELLQLGLTVKLAQIHVCNRLPLIITDISFSLDDALIRQFVSGSVDANYMLLIQNRGSVGSGEVV